MGLVHRHDAMAQGKAYWALLLTIFNYEQILYYVIESPSLSFLIYATQLYYLRKKVTTF